MSKKYYVEDEFMKEEQSKEIDGYEPLTNTYEGVANSAPSSKHASSYSYHYSSDSRREDKICRDLHSTMDAKVWAKEFCDAYRNLYNRDIDEKWIHAWMSNAIMCGYDHQSWKRDKQYIYILKTIHGEILNVFDFEPDQFRIREECTRHFPYDIIGHDHNIFDHVRVFRWSKNYGLMEMSGPKSDTQYEWKSN